MYCSLLIITAHSVHLLSSISAQNVDYGTLNFGTIGPFSQNSRRACVTVQITDDGIAENVESFLAMLVVNATAPSLLLIQPANTTVNILDNDGEQLAGIVNGSRLGSFVINYDIILTSSLNLAT